MKRHGQEPDSVFEYATISAIPYLISLEGWGLFFHQPIKADIDLTAKKGRFSVYPAQYRDIFVMRYDKPVQAAQLYYEVTGKAPMLPKYAFGYQQSYRELFHNGESIVMPTAKYMRENNIPCDTLIYLGRYIKQGWNTYGHNGMFEFNKKTFPKPREMMNELHEMGYKVVLHITETPSGLHGTLDDENANPLEHDHVANYWKRHEKLYEYAQNDGWWPDDGDELDYSALHSRHRMYYDGTEKLTPNRRGFYMLRNSYCGDLKYGGVIWSGDVLCKWETLKNHIQIGMNVGLSLSPYWGSDIGGFHVTDELSGELYIRWFQYSVFTPFLRSHGRHSFLHMPWGWKAKSLSEIPDEWAKNLASNVKEDALPDNRVEPICVKYIELRYRLLPYIYTLAHEAADKGIPILRPLWFSFSHDKKAAVCQNQYMFGDGMLVNPVTENGAIEWSTYLPEGIWYDFFTNESIGGLKDVKASVGLEDIPVFVGAGSIIPLGDVKQYIGDRPINPLDDSLTVQVYTGSDGEFTLYEDDGITKEYLTGNGTYTKFVWHEREKELEITGSSSQISEKSREFYINYIGLDKSEVKTCKYKNFRRVEQ